MQIAFREWRPAVISNQMPAPDNSAARADFSQFWVVWEKLSELYVDKSALDPTKMVEGAISGMVAAVGDPYTSYLPPQQNKETKEDLGGAFDGVGIQLGFRDNRLAVVAPLPETPAAKAGVRAGDYILHIKDEAKSIDRDTEGLALPEAVKLIRGEKGTRVQLTLARDGAKELIKVDLARDTIVVKSAIVELVDQCELVSVQCPGKKIAWVKLTRFGDRTGSEWGEVVNQILNSEQKIGGAVLDLRNNPGGYLEGAVYIAGEFLPAGRVVVSQRYGDGTQTPDKVKRNGALLSMPLAVVVNKGSASAAEILAGALQDYKRARIVGEQSFGKGSVQQPEDFADGSGLHVTIARWLRPSGDWIDKKGITPDAIVKWEPDASATDSAERRSDLPLVKAVELLKL